MTLTRKLSIALGIVAVAWLVVIVVWGPAPFALSFDDAYYYFTIGRNWAQGHASTFGLLDTTNGYHPLWQAVSTVPFLLGLDGLAAVRFLLVVQLILWAVAMTAVIRIVAPAVDTRPRLDDLPGARRLGGAAIVAAFVVLTANPFVFKMTVNGLESGLVVPVGAVLLAYAIGFRGRFVSRASDRQRWVTSVLLALAFGARTDAVILLAVLAVWCVMDAADSKLARGERLRRFAQLFVVPAVVIVAYLAVNRAVFGTALQISGVVKRLPLTPVRGALVVVWAAIGLVVLRGAHRPVKRTSRAPMTRRFIATTGWYGAFCVGLIGYYVTLQEVPYLWYFAPLALYGTILLVLLVGDLAVGAVEEAARADKPASGIATRIPALILLVPLAVVLVLSIPSTTDPGARALLVHDAAAGTWIAGHLPPDARIASWDAGAIGYFAHRRMVNLDGVVNSLEWYHALRDGRTAQFLAARKVEWVANHGGAVDGHDPDIDAQIRALFGRERARVITPVHGEVYHYTGTIDGSRTDTSTKEMGTWVYRVGP